MRRSSKEFGLQSLERTLFRKHSLTRALLIRTGPPNYSQSYIMIHPRPFSSSSSHSYSPSSLSLNSSINDYGTEGLNSKSDTLFNVVKGYLADNVPLNGIGFQCHFPLGQVPSTLQQNLQRFSDLGLDVAITELDINIGTGNPQNATAFALQAQDYWTVVNACVNVERCVGVVSVMTFFSSSTSTYFEEMLDVRMILTSGYLMLR